MSGGHPMMLIHGMCQNGAAMDRVGNAFAGHGYDCFSATLLAHDSVSNHSVNKLSLSEFTEDLYRQFQEWAPATPPVIVGHSMGGLLALKLAEKIEARALVLLTPAPPAGINLINVGGLAITAAVFTRDPLLNKGFKPALQAFKKTAVAGLPDPQQREVHEKLVFESSRAVLEMGLWPFDADEAARVNFGNIQCPSFLVSAGRDLLVSSASVRKLAALLPVATVKDWPQRGHMVIHDSETEVMVDEAAAWLEKYAPTKVSAA